jgi:TonB family protein
MKSIVRQRLIAFTLLLVGASGAVQGQQDETIDDRDVKLVSFVDLQYPVLAKSARVQGVVVVRVGLDDQGRVTTASALSGPKPLIPDCLASARRWTFRPNPRKSAIHRLRVQTRRGACHDDTHSLFRLVHFNFASITACVPVIGG